MEGSILAADLDRLLKAGAKVRVFDVRLEKDRVDVEHPIPGAEWRNPKQVAEWSGEIDEVDEIIVHCVHGHHVSQSVRDALRSRGIRSRLLEGGIEAWCEYAREESQSNT